MSWPRIFTAAVFIGIGVALALPDATNGQIIGAILIAWGIIAGAQA